MFLGINADNSNGLIIYQNNTFNMIRCTQNGKHMVAYNNRSYTLEHVTDVQAKSAKTVQLIGSISSKPLVVLQTSILTGFGSESVLKSKQTSHNIQVQI